MYEYNHKIEQLADESEIARCPWCGAYYETVQSPWAWNYYCPRCHPVPHPGSQAAIDAGCTCPVMDNSYGQGYLCKGSGVFLYNMGCPVHGDSACEDK